MATRDRYRSAYENAPVFTTFAQGIFKAMRKEQYRLDKPHAVSPRRVTVRYQPATWTTPPILLK